MESTVETCPECGAAMPVVVLFPTWCDRCEWNIAVPPDAVRYPSRLDILTERLAVKAATRLSAEVAAAEDLRPRLTLARVAAYGISVLTMAIAAAVLAGGVWLVVIGVGRPNVFATLAGGVLVLVAFLMRPRLGKPPTDDVVDRADAPSLYRLADQVAKHAGTASADRIVVDESWNASWAIVGPAGRGY